MRFTVTFTDGTVLKCEAWGYHETYMQAVTSHPDKRIKHITQP